MSGEGTLLGLMLWFKFSVETFVRLCQKNYLVAQNSECNLEWVEETHPSNCLQRWKATSPALEPLKND